MKKTTESKKQVKILPTDKRPLAARELVGIVGGAAGEATTAGVLRPGGGD